MAEGVHPSTKRILQLVLPVRWRLGHEIQPADCPALKAWSGRYDPIGRGGRGRSTVLLPLEHSAATNLEATGKRYAHLRHAVRKPLWLPAAMHQSRPDVSVIRAHAAALPVRLFPVASAASRNESRTFPNGVAAIHAA